MMQWYPFAPQKALHRFRLEPLPFVTALFLIGTLAQPAAGEEPRIAAVKATFLYRFASDIEWPETSGKEFSIVVVAADDVANELRGMLARHRIHGLPCRVRTLAGTDGLAGVQILYVGRRRAALARSLLARASGHPVLVVTDEERGLPPGAMINFLLIDHHVRFEVSLTAAERVGLKVSAGMLSVAERVEGSQPRLNFVCGGTDRSSPLGCAWPSIAVDSLHRVRSSGGRTSP